MTVAPGWYKDPAEPATQRYWDGEGWVGPALPADAPTPPTPPTRETAPASPKPSGPTASNTAAPGAASTLGVPSTPGVPGTPAAPGAAMPNGATPPAVPLPPGAPLPPEWVLHRPPPAPRPHGLALATPGARLVARLIDIVVVGTLALLANGYFIYRLISEFIPFYEEVMSQGRDANPEAANRINTLLLIIPLVTMLVWLAYEVPALANTGQTLGKRMAGIKVVRLESDERLGVGRSLRRFSTLGLPTMLWTCFGLGLVLQFVDCLFVAIDRPLNQALHDKSAHTVVVHVGRPAATPDGGPR